MKTCAGPDCPETFEPKRPNRVFCSSRCKQAAGRARKKAGAAPTPAEPPPEVETGTRTLGGKRASQPLVDAVRKELREADALDSVDGQIAVILAEQTAVAQGSAASSLAKELRVVVDRATGGPKPVPTGGADADRDSIEEPEEDEVTRARKAREEARQAAGIA